MCAQVKRDNSTTSLDTAVASQILHHMPTFVRVHVCSELLLVLAYGAVLPQSCCICAQAAARVLCHVRARALWS